MESEALFCDKCGRQLYAINEIDLGVCDNCKTSIKEVTKKRGFICWACGKEIATMNEIAQGICHNCKAYIIRTLR